MLLVLGGWSQARAEQSEDTLPSVAQGASVNEYRKCLRYQERGHNGPANAREELGPDPTPLPLISSFARVVDFCRPERISAISTIRIEIRKRHPDWRPDRTNEGAEKVLSRFEMSIFQRWIAPTMTSHGPIEDF